MNNSILKYLISSSLIFVLMLMNACTDKEPAVTTTHELSEEMMAYFVDYEVGARWVYEDTITGQYDTIQLMSKEAMNVNSGNGTLSVGFVLYYKPKYSKDFKVYVSAGANNSCYVKVDPLVSGVGKIVFENSNGNWNSSVVYSDSVEIKGSRYYEVVQSQNNNMYQYNMHVSKAKGIVFFRYRNIDVTPSVGADYRLIKVLKP